jgi:prophage regulatory protein
MREARIPHILRRRQVEAQTGLSRSAIYEGVLQGTFPRPIHIGTRAVGWLAAEVDAWIAARIAVSRHCINSRPSVTASSTTPGAGSSSIVQQHRTRITVPTRQATRRRTR